MILRWLSYKTSILSKHWWGRIIPTMPLCTSTRIIHNHSARGAFRGDAAANAMWKRLIASEPEFSASQTSKISKSSLLTSGSNFNYSFRGICQLKEQEKPSARLIRNEDQTSWWPSCRNMRWELDGHNTILSLVIWTMCQSLTLLRSQRKQGKGRTGCLWGPVQRVILQRWVCTAGLDRTS